MASPDKIKVLIVDDIAETRENIRKLLQFEGDVEVVGAARTGSEAIELAKETAPDVVLMDINMPDMDGITATERIKKILPASQIVILSVQNDPSYMRRAMMAGARDFLSKPPTVDDLTSAIRRAGEMAHQERAKLPMGTVPGSGATASSASYVGIMQGSIIVVYSPKGGTGCTTLATNLAISLNNKDTPAALVDANLQYGDAAFYFKEQPRYSMADIASRAEELDHDLVQEVLVDNSASGVKILAAPASPEYAEGITGEQFAKVVNYMRRMFAYIIVDTSSYLSDSVLSVIDEADVIVMVTTQEVPAIRNVRVFLELLRNLKIDKQRVVLALNRYDKRIGISPEQIADGVRQEVSAVIPLDEQTVIPAVNRGIPFMLKDKARPVARSVLSLAEVIRQRIQTLQESSGMAADRRVTKQ